MDYSYLLSLSMLPTGQYDVWGRRFKMERKKALLNYFCAGICFFCGLKYIAIMLLPQETNSILYLSELYLYELPGAILWHFGCTVIHFNVSFEYVYMASICQDGSRFDCLRFMFMPNLDDLCEHYDLDKKSTGQFFKMAKRARYLMYSIMISFEGFYFVLLARCFVTGYFEIEFKYFVAFTAPLTAITWFSYQCLIVSIPTMLIFLLTTKAFIQLRFETVAQQVRRFWKAKKIHRNRRRQMITQTINDIVRQFNASNILFDDLM